MTVFADCMNCTYKTQGVPVWYVFAIICIFLVVLLAVVVVMQRGRRP
jgi:hypothetical protein